jgi:hypothetical protein
LIFITKHDCIQSSRLRRFPAGLWQASETRHFADAE